jgi:YggT family protein
MDFFQLTMRVLSALLMMYFFLIMLRIILSWVPGSSEGTHKIRDLVGKLTDPYMNRFRNISWLRFGMLDFSPVLGLAILSFFLYLTQSLSSGSIPSIGELIILIIQLVWGIIAFLAVIFAVTMLVRLVTLYTIKGQRPNWIDRLDAFLFPRVSRILGLFTNKAVSYPLALGICAFALLTLRFGIGWILERYLYPLLASI